MAQKEYDLTTEKAAMEEMQKDLVEKVCQGASLAQCCTHKGVGSWSLG